MTYQQALAVWRHRLLPEPVRRENLRRIARVRAASLR